MTLYACPKISALDPLDPTYDSNGHEIADTATLPDPCSCGLPMVVAGTAWVAYAQPRNFRNLVLEVQIAEAAALAARRDDI